MISKQRNPDLTGGCQCGAVRCAKMENFQHPDHDTLDGWTPKGTTGG